MAEPLHLPTQSVSSCHDCTRSSHTPSPSVPSLSPSPAAQDRQPWTASPLPPPLPLGCAEQPEGLPGITGLSVTLRPFPSLWSRGHTAPGLKVTAGERKKGAQEEEGGHPLAPFVEEKVSQGSGWSCCFCSSRAIMSPRGPSADPPFPDHPYSLGCPCR